MMSMGGRPPLAPNKSRNTQPVPSKTEAIVSTNNQNDFINTPLESERILKAKRFQEKMNAAGLDDEGKLHIPFN
jgi:hypothetical protein